MIDSRLKTMVSGVRPTVRAPTFGLEHTGSNGSLSIRGQVPTPSQSVILRDHGAGRTKFYTVRCAERSTEVMSPSDPEHGSRFQAGPFRRSEVDHLERVATLNQNMVTEWDSGEQSHCTPLTAASGGGGSPPSDDSTTYARVS